MTNNIAVSITSVCDFIGGNQPPKIEFRDSPQLGYVRLLQIRDFESDLKAVYVKDKPTLKKCLEDDILIGRYGASVGKVLTGKKGAYNVALMKVIPKRDISNRFVYYILKSFQFQAFIKTISESRAAQAGFNQNDLNRFFFYLPDEKQQNKIVLQLDIIQKLIDTRLEAIKILHVLKRSLLSNLLMSNMNNLYYESLSKLVLTTQYGISDLLNDDNRGYPVIRMNNITYQGSLNLVDMKYFQLDKEQLLKYELRERDVLFNRTNSRDLVGKTAVWDDRRGYAYAGYIFRVRVNEKTLNPYYLSAYLNSLTGKEMLFNKSRQSGSMANFSASLLLKQKIPVLPIDLQKKLEFQHTKIDKLIFLLNKSIAFLEEIFNSVLQNIFKKNHHIDEEIIFNELINHLKLEDLKGNKKRLQYLINLFDENKFDDEKSYSSAKEKLFELILENEIEQIFDEDKIKLEVKNHEAS